MRTKFSNPLKRQTKTTPYKEIPLESQEQITLINWWELYSATKHIHNKCLFAIPNGGFRNARESHRFKQEGVRAGIPDLMLSVPCGAFHGLFIELKRVKKGRVSEDQKEMLVVLAKLGYKTIVCYGFEEAKKAIETYLGDYHAN